MALIKTKDEIALMAHAGKILAKVLRHLAAAVQPGVLPVTIDELAKTLTEAYGGEPAFLGYQSHGDAVPFPASLCVSVNDGIVHGIPGERPFADGDLVKLDFGVRYLGWFADSATTVAVGNISKEARRLMEVTRRSLALGIRAAKPGNTIGDIGYAVQSCVEAEGFSVIRDLVGHGIGNALHEEPQVPNFGAPHTGMELTEGMVIAIEPMVAAGGWKLKLSDDRWTYTTADGSLAAHFEHTVEITKHGARILTK